MEIQAPDLMLAQSKPLCHLGSETEYGRYFTPSLSNFLSNEIYKYLKSKIITEIAIQKLLIMSLHIRK